MNNDKFKEKYRQSIVKVTYTYVLLLLAYHLLSVKRNGNDIEA